MAYRGRGLGRLPGAVIIAGYLAFVTALAVTVEQGGVRPAAAVIPGRRHRRCRCRAAELAAPATGAYATPARSAWWRQESVLGGWTIGRLWKLSLLLCSAIAAGDAASGPHLILIGFLIVGPCCALLTARWALTAAATCFALALGVVLGVPDQIFATVTQFAFLAAVTTVGAVATVGAAVLQRHRP